MQRKMIVGGGALTLVDRPDPHNFLRMCQYPNVSPTKAATAIDPDFISGQHRLRRWVFLQSKLAAALRWAFAKCPSIDSLTVAETIAMRTDVLRLPIYQLLRRIRLTGDCEEHDRFIRALSRPDQSGLTKLEFGSSSFRKVIDQDLVHALVRRHAASLRHLDTHRLGRRFRR